MELRWYRKIGMAYAMVGLIASAFGAILFFRQLTNQYAQHCDESSCEAVVNIILLAMCTLMCILSAFVIIFVLVGIRENLPGYIAFNKIFMLIRNCTLTVRFTYEAIALIVAHINKEAPPNVEKSLTVCFVALVVIAALTPLEMWILKGVQSDVKQRDMPVVVATTTSTTRTRARPRTRTVQFADTSENTTMDSSPSKV